MRTAKNHLTLELINPQDIIPLTTEIINRCNFKVNRFIAHYDDKPFKAAYLLEVGIVTIQSGFHSSIIEWSFPNIFDEADFYHEVQSWRKVLDELHKKEAILLGEKQF